MITRPSLHASVTGFGHRAHVHIKLKRHKMRSSVYHRSVFFGIAMDFGDLTQRTPPGSPNDHNHNLLDFGNVAALDQDSCDSLFRDPYHLVTSDILDDEIASTCEQVESRHRRFGELPASVQEATEKSLKRYFCPASLIIYS
jgi:hypothetical protein